MAEKSIVSSSVNVTTEAKQCGSCEDGMKATGYCRDCSEFVCDECQAVHKKLKIMKHHKIVTLNEFQAQAANLILPKKVIPNCPKHPENALKIYCETCSILICNDCTIRLHRDHNYDLLADAFSKHKEELVSSLKPVKQKLGTVQQALKSLDTRAKDQRAALKDSINKEIEKLHQLLDKRKAQLENELDMLTSQQIETERNHLESFQTKMSNLLAEVESTLETGTNFEIMEKKATICHEIQTLLTDSKVVSDMCETQIYLCPADSDSFYKALTSVSIKTKRHSQEVTTSTKEITTETLQPTHEYRPTDVIDPQIESQDLMPKAKRIKVSETPTSMIKKLKYPWKVAHNSEGNIIVTEREGEKVSIFRSNGQPIRMFGGKGSKKGKFNCPSGVAVDDEDNIYIAEYNGHRVQKFSQDGTFLLATGTQGQESLQFDTPDGVGYNKYNGKIYVCEEVNCRIQILNRDLTFYRMFGKEGTKNEELNGPSGIDFDRDGNVYVADTDNHRIQVFTSEGNFIRKFGTEIGLKEPTDIAICHDTGMVYVTTSKDQYPVWKFNEDGECVETFGGKGIREGQFKLGSSGITINTDGAIPVTDRGNGRVQIFSTSC